MTRFLVTAIILLVNTVIAFGQNPLLKEGINPYHYHQQKHVEVSHAAVVSAHPIASEVGAMIMKKGGNAVDAAIATEFALAVVFPGAGNIGGGGFMVIHTKGDKNTTIDYREKAPGHASRDMYLEKNGQPDMNLSQKGRLAVGVPGTVAGLFKAHEYARLPMKELIQPAIDLAKYGFALTASEAENLNDTKTTFLKYNSSPIPFIKNTPWKAGDTLVQKALAYTLELIRDKGPAGFYEGETAKKIVAEMKKGNGIITLADLKNYQAVERQPIAFDYEGCHIISMPLPSSGGILLQQMLEMTALYPIAGDGFETPKSVQLMVEIERRAYADRAKFLGDMDFVKVPLKQLVSKSYIKQRMSTFAPGKATPSSQVEAGQLVNEKEETTHICTVDDDGNAVSSTYTLNGWYGSKVVVAGAGFFLNDEMDDFSVKPGTPNMFGLIGAEANAIAPNKRMLSSMTPTIVLKNNQPYLITGTPGGSTIITSVYQTILDVLDFHLSLSNAVNKPKFHHQWLPDLVYVEDDFPEAVKVQLQKEGYHVKTRGAIGRTEAIKIQNHQIEAVGDHRGDDTAVGF